MLRPRSVSAIHVDGAKVDDEVVHGVHDYLTVYTIISIASLLLIAIDNFSMETSLTRCAGLLKQHWPRSGSGRTDGELCVLFRWQ